MKYQRHCKYCPKSNPLSEYTQKPDGTFYVMCDKHRAYVARKKRNYVRQKPIEEAKADYFKCDVACEYWDHCNQEVIKHNPVWLPCTPIEEWPVLVIQPKELVI